MKTVPPCGRFGFSRWLLPAAIILAILCVTTPLRAQPGFVTDSNRCTPPPSGMVGWWSLDETFLTPGTLVADLTGNASSYFPANTPNNGAVVGLVLAAPGKVAGGFHFNGDRSQYVRVPNHPDLNVGRGDFSIDAWVRPDNLDINAVIADKRDGVGNVRGYSLFLYGGHPGVQLADDSSGWYNFVAYNATVPQGQWAMVAVTVDRDSPSGGRLYLNGQVVLTFDPRVRPGSLDNNGNFYIGISDIYASVPFTGTIDEVELFKRALDPQEIARIYGAGSAGKCKNAVQPPDSNRCTPPPAGMIAWWPLDEMQLAPGAHVADLTANPFSYYPTNNANTGTVAGALVAQPGKVAGGFLFNGDRSRYVRVPNSPDLNLGRGDFSIDAWIRPDVNVINGVVVDKRQDIGNVRGYSLFMYGSHPGIQLADDSSGWYNYVAYNATVQPGQWYLLAATVDRDNAAGGRLYLNGQVVLTFDPRNRMGSLDNAGDLFIGKSDIYASAPFNGMIDEVELFNRALDPQEIARIFNAGAAGKCKSGAQPPPDSGRCTPPPPSLVGWWSGDEANAASGSGIEDLTGNPLKFSPANAANNGVAVGNVVSVPGTVAGALRFDGSPNSYVRVPNHPDLNPDTTDFSIDAWIRSDATTGNRIIVDKRQAVGNQVRGFSFYTYGNSLGFQMGDNLTYYRNFGTGSADIVVGRWHFVAVTVSRKRSDGGRLYVDGRLKGVFDPRGAIGSLNTGSDFYIGKSDIWACVPFAGAIDEVEFFRRSLDSMEIARIYNAGSDGKCKTAARPPTNPCDSIWGEGHQEECCSYSIGINKEAGALQSLRYTLLLTPGTNSFSGTMRSVSATPCRVAATSPANLDGSHGGFLTFDTACTRRNSTRLVIEGNSAAADGQVCMDLAAIVVTPSGEYRECHRTICFHCSPVTESRCDELTVAPYVSQVPHQSVRLFTIANTKAPAAPICSVAVALSPAVQGLSGGVLVVDGVPHSWPAFSSGNYTMIGSQHGLPAQHTVQFALGLNYLTGWNGTVTITTYHCDGRTCTMTYRWVPQGGRNLELTREPDLLGEDVCMSRIAFTRTRLPWPQVRTIGLHLHQPAGRILALSPATMPCQPDAPDCDDLFENVIVNGSIAMVQLRDRGYDYRNDSIRSGDPEIMLICRAPSGARVMADLVYFDSTGRELGTDSVLLCGREASGVTVPTDPTTGSLVNVYPNPANTGFTVGFTVRQAAMVEVEVYDLLGRPVLRQPATMLEAGMHQVPMNAAGLPGGTYFVRVRGGGADGTERVEVGR
ncbi:MAG TPA: LamG-like jellyroll fold domain-containing protein [Candidatus Kapabacteria bacterium]|nr:LamG-like jellyroll fold domain-containing protein [Candidatus Kapabacteria bacterium]